MLEYPFAEAYIVALRPAAGDAHAEAAMAAGRSSNWAQGRLKVDPAWHRFAGRAGARRAYAMTVRVVRPLPGSARDSRSRVRGSGYARTVLLTEAPLDLCRRDRSTPHFLRARSCQTGVDTDEIHEEANHVPKE